MKTKYQHNENMVCPYCDHELFLSWEHKENSGTIVCNNCNKEFEYTREVRITYSTYTV